MENEQNGGLFVAGQNGKWKMNKTGTCLLQGKMKNEQNMGLVCCLLSPLATARLLQPPASPNPSERGEYPEGGLLRTFERL
jgi:hypothetical protein